MPTGGITYPGVIAPVHLVATRTVGTHPDIAVLYCRPQSTSPDCSGLATLQFGFNGVGVTWTNCLCDRGTLQLSTTGHFEVLEIFDCRWLWRKAYITRAYNIRQPDGSIDPETLASLEQIASDLLTAMGVALFDVSAITSAELPEIVCDRDVAADILDELLLERGYVVALNLDDSVTIYQRGVGTSLPFNGDIISVAFSLDPPEIPFYQTAVANKTLVQSKLLCRPVGVDVDGSILPVALLSYTPAGGWDGCDLNNFDYITDETAQDCAIQSVGKWYQVLSQADGTFNLSDGVTNYSPGEILVTSANQYLPLEDRLVSSRVDVFGKVRFDPAYVEGTVFGTDADGVPAIASNSTPFVRINRRDWELNKELGIVIFKEPAFKKSPGPVAGVQTFADIYLTCSYAVDGPSFVKDRFHVTQTLGGLGEELHKVDELQRLIVANYIPGTASVSSIDDNKASVIVSANLFLTTAEARYQTQVGNVVFYRGIYPIGPDGINLQIRWDCAKKSISPFGTHITQYFEGLPLIATGRERDLIRRVRMNENPTNTRNKRFRDDKDKLR